jgi:hypothetical protein
MRRTPVTLGILSMVFGSLIALWNALQLAISVATPTLVSHMGELTKNLPQKPGQPDPQLVMSRMAETTRALAPYTEALMGGKLLLSIALIVIGYGLSQRRSWSRSGAIAWGGLALLFTFAEAIVQATIIQPRSVAAIKAVMASAPNAAALQQTMGLQSTALPLLLVAVFAPFPIVLLALCGRRSAAADFTD